MPKSRYAILSLVLAIVLCAGLSNPASAQVRVTVSGTDYDIITTPGSFNAVQSSTGNALTDIARTPWFTGDSIVAAAFVMEWLNAATATSIPDGELILFVYDTSPGSFTALVYLNNSGTYNRLIPTLGNATDPTFFGGTNNFASVLVAPVPEINGNALAQMLLVLFVGYMMIHSRHRQAREMASIT